MEPHTHVVSPRVYVGIFLALIVLTAVTTAVAFVDLGPLNVVIMLVIAFLKASLVVLFFMHARYESQLTRVTILGAVFWLFVLILISASDVFIRFRPDAVAPLGLRTETAAVIPTPAPHPQEQPGAAH